MSEKRQDKPFGIEEAKNVYAEGLACGMRLGARQMRERCAKVVEAAQGSRDATERLAEIVRAIPEEP